MKVEFDEATLQKLGKEEIFKLVPEYQFKLDSTLTTNNYIKTDLSELRKNQEKLGFNLMETKQMNAKLCDQKRFLERQ